MAVVKHDPDCDGKVRGNCQHIDVSCLPNAVLLCKPDIDPVNATSSIIRRIAYLHFESPEMYIFVTLRAFKPTWERAPRFSRAHWGCTSISFDKPMDGLPAQPGCNLFQSRCPNGTGINTHRPLQRAYEVHYLQRNRSTTLWDDISWNAVRFDR
jgi:hypothetical protein